ncbi:MAG: ABC transporter permease subunit [Planctomycetaceae bacterium]
MIHHVLVRKYAAQSLLLWSSCGLALFSFAWVRVWVISLLDMGQFRTILEQFRDFERFAPIPFDALFTHTGRVGMAFDEPIVILCTVVWCISRGSDVVSGELGRGTMEMMLSQAISRTTLLLSHAVVSIAGLVGLCLLLWAGLAAGIATTSVTETLPVPSVRIPFTMIEVPLTTAEPVKETFLMSDRVDWQIYGTGVFSLFAFGFFLLGLSTLLSSMDRYRWRTIGAVVSIYVFQLVLFGLGKSAERLDWLRATSFFNCYRPQKLITLVVDEGYWAPWRWTGADSESWFGPIVYPVMLIAGGLVCYAAAIMIFRRRDLPAPL